MKSDTLIYSVLILFLSSCSQAQQPDWYSTFWPHMMVLIMIVDRTSLEVFVDEGAFTLVLQMNLKSDMKGISLELKSEFKLTVKNLEIFEMKSIWE